MTQLTDDQLARRAAARRNNRLRKSMPLFAALLVEGGAMAGWLTTDEQQKERILRQHAAFERVRAGWKNQDAEFKTLGDNRRALVARKVEPDVMADLDQRYLDVFSNHGPEYWADYWWRKLVEFAPDEAHERCPNGGRHDGFRLWHEQCPTCGLTLERCAHNDGAAQLVLQGVC